MRVAVAAAVTFMLWGPACTHTSLSTETLRSQSFSRASTASTASSSITTATTTTTTITTIITTTNGTNNTDDKCLYDELKHSERCAYLRANPDSCEGGMVHMYLEQYACAKRGRGALYIVIGALLMVWLFYLLGTTADAYFCPVVEELSDRMGLSPRLAGVTMLSLGNGAPDVFAGIAAMRKGHLPLVLGQIVGGGMFVTSVVAGAVIMAAGGIRTRFPLLRDMMMFELVLSVLLALIYGKVLVYQIAAFLLAYYVLFVSLAWWSDRRLIRRKASEASHHNRSATLLAPTTLSSMTRLERTHSQAEIVNTEYRISRRRAPSLGSILDYLSYANEGVHRRTHAAYVASAANGLITWLEGPFTVLRSVTIINCTQERWSVDNDSRLKAAVACLGTPLLVGYWQDLLGGSVGGCPTYVIWLVGGLVLALLFMRTCPYAEPPMYSVLCLMVGFLCSAAWIDLLADQLVNLLTASGYILGLSSSFMGATVLAWGNSVGDLSADMLLARNGRECMAITACYAGPMFNVLVILGLGLIIMGASSLSTTVQLTAGLQLCFGFLIGQLVVSTLVAFRQGRSDKAKGNRLPTKYCWVLWFVYLVFMVSMVCQEVRRLDRKDH